MRLKYDREADIIYLRFSEDKIAESDELKPGLIVDYDDKGNPVAIEILNAKHVLKGKPELIVDFSQNILAA
jgi:uncharacterized protein YuzE